MGLPDIMGTENVQNVHGAVGVEETEGTVTPT